MPLPDDDVEGLLSVDLELVQVDILAEQLFDLLFFFSSRRRHTRLTCDWSSDVCSSDLERSGSLRAASPPVSSAGWPNAEAAVTKSRVARDRKSTRLNSSHMSISYAV